MANEKLKQNYKNIANSIRAKTGKNGTIKADEMAAEIDSIETGIEPTGTINITTNGTHNVAQYGEANVNVPNPSTGTKNITTNGDHDVTAFATAHVAVPGPSGSINIISNRHHLDVSNYEYANVYVLAAEVDNTNFDWNADVLGHKIFGLDTTDDGSATTCIDTTMIDDNGSKTFSCNLFGKVAAFKVYLSGSTMMLDEGYDWVYTQNSDDYYVMCSCIMGKCYNKDIRAVGLSLDVDSGLSGDAVKSWLQENYSNYRIIFTDLLGNVLYEVHLYDLVNGGGS